MNLSKYFTDKPLNKILKHHDQIYKLREVAGTREEKLNALAKQIEMLNTMNEGGKVKLKLPQDFVSHFLDDQDVDDIWAATHINKGISDKATILGDMRQVWKIFTYLDFIEDEKKKKEREEENKGAHIVPDLVEKKEEKKEEKKDKDDKKEIDNDDDDDGKEEEKAEILEDKDDKDEEPKGPFFSSSMAQSVALDQYSWNLNNIEDMLRERDFMANIILDGPRRGGASPHRRGRRRRRRSPGGKDGKGHAWSGIGGFGTRVGKGFSDLLWGNVDVDLNRALLYSLGYDGANDLMSNDRSSSVPKKLGSKSERALAKKKKIKKPKSKSPTPTLPKSPSRSPPPQSPSRSPPPQSPKTPEAGKNAKERRRYIYKHLGHTKKPASNIVYDNLKAAGVHDSDYDPDSEVSEHESDGDVIKEMEKDQEKEKDKNKTTTKTGKDKSKDKSKDKTKKKVETPPTSSESESESEYPTSSESEYESSGGVKKIKKRRKSKYDKLLEEAETLKNRPNVRTLKQAKKQVRDAEARKKKRLAKARKEREKQKEEEEKNKKSKKKKKKKNKDKDGTTVIVRRLEIEKQDEDEKYRKIYKSMDDKLYKRVEKMVDKLGEYHLSSRDARVKEKLDGQVDLLLAEYGEDLGKFSVQRRNALRDKVERLMDLAETILKNQDKEQEKQDKIRSKTFKEDKDRIDIVRTYTKVLAGAKAYMTKKDITELDQIISATDHLEMFYDGSGKFDAIGRDEAAHILAKLQVNKLKPLVARVQKKKREHASITAV